MRNIVLLLNTTRMYTRGLLKGIAQYGHLQGQWIFYRPLDYREPTPPGALVKVLAALKPDGIFMREPDQMSQIIEMGIPTVSFPYTVERIEGIANVVADHMTIGEMAARHLLDRGFRYFAYCGFDDWWWSRRRREGFCKAVRQAGYKSEVFELPPKARRTWDKELTTIADWLRTLPTPVGLMACNDDRGQLIIEACRMAGLHVPDQVAVVGVDNDPLVCELCSPSLSSVAMGLEKAGYESAVLMDQIISGEHSDIGTIFIEPTHVVARLSTDALMVGDGEVASAIQFIRQQAKRNINVDDVVSHVTLSRRVLEKRFRHILGKSIHEEIRHERVELVAKMLIETHMSISEITNALDFEAVSHLSRYFRTEKGISPVQFRKQYAR